MTDLKQPIEWQFVDASAWDDSVRCKSMRGPRSKIRCEVYEGHNDAHCGRGKSGRWFWW